MRSIRHGQYDLGTSNSYEGNSFFRRNRSALIGTGAALAAVAAYVQYKSRKAERENPPAGKFIEVDGIRLHYLERGRGQPVVVFHGNGTMAKEIDISGLLDLASDKYRMIVFDRPGYGYSERPRTTIWDPIAQARLFDHALRQMGIEKPIVVGHSWGAMVAVALGLERPQDVQSLVLVGGYYYPTPRIDVPLFSPPAIPVIGDLLRYTMSPIFGWMVWPAMLRKMFYPKKPTARFKEEYPVWMGLRPGQIRAASAEIAMLIPAAYRLMKRYHDLRVPVVLLAGTGDIHALPRLHSERLHHELPQSELIMVPDAGHMVTHTSPLSIVAAIDRGANMQSLVSAEPSYFPGQARQAEHAAARNAM